MRRSGPFFPPPPAPVWRVVGREGSAVLVGSVAGSPGTRSGICIIEHPATPPQPWLPQEGGAAAAPSQATTEKPVVFPLPQAA